MKLCVNNYDFNDNCQPATIVWKRQENTFSDLHRQRTHMFVSKTKTKKTKTKKTKTKKTKTKKTKTKAKKPYMFVSADFEIVERDNKVDSSKLSGRDLAAQCSLPKGDRMTQIEGEEPKKVNTPNTAENIFKCWFEKPP